MSTQGTGGHALAVKQGMVLFVFTQVFVVWVAFLVSWDICTRRLPDHLTLPGAGIIGLWAVVVEPWFLMGGMGWFLLYLVSAGVVRGIGGGDIKFALGLGTVAATGGVKAWMMAVVGASLFTIALAGVLAVVYSHPRMGVRVDRRVPHGPGMAIATCCALVVVQAW